MLHLINPKRFVMAFTTTIQQIEKPVPVNRPSNDITDALLSMIILSVYGAQMSKKSLRKLKRKLFWTSLKLKIKSFFKPRANISERTLIYILLGALFLILIIYSPIAAVVLIAVALILILAGVI